LGAKKMCQQLIGMA